MMSPTLKRVLLVVLIIGIIFIIGGALLMGFAEMLFPFNSKPLYTTLFSIGGVALATDLLVFLITLDEWDN